MGSKKGKSGWYIDGWMLQGDLGGWAMLALKDLSGDGVGTVTCVVWSWKIQSWSSASAIWIQILSLQPSVGTSRYKSCSFSHLWALLDTNPLPSAICEHFWIQILSLLKPVDFSGVAAELLCTGKAPWAYSFRSGITVAWRIMDILPVYRKFFRSSGCW